MRDVGSHLKDSAEEATRRMVVLVNIPPRCKVMWSDELLETMVLRDNECNRIVVDIGLPNLDGIYTPTLTRDKTDNPLTDLRKQFGIDDAE